MEDVIGHRCPVGHDLCACLAEIVGKRVDETVLVVHQQDFQSLAGFCVLLPGGCLAGKPRLAHGSAHGLRLEFGFRFFVLRDAVVKKRGPGADLGQAVLDAHGSKGEAGVHVTIEQNSADGAAIPGTGRLFVILDELHRPTLGGAGHGDGPGMRQERIERIHVGAQNALDMVHRVDQARVHFDLAAADHLDRTWHANTALVVAVDVRTHGQLGFVLRGVQQLADLGLVLDRVFAAPDGSGNRTGFDAPAAGDPHIHFRRRADEIFCVAQIEERRNRAMD